MITAADISSGDDAIQEPAPKGAQLATESVEIGSGVATQWRRRRDGMTETE